MNSKRLKNSLKRQSQIQNSVHAPNAAENICGCQSNFQVVIGRPDDYARAKKILNNAKYPAFIGRNNWERNSVNGGCLFYLFQDESIACTISNPKKNQLLSMAVLKSHQGHGLGDVINKFLNSSFVRSTEQMTPWFEKRGYERIGEPIQGRSLKTIILVKKGLRETSGRLRRIYEKG